MSALNLESMSREQIQEHLSACIKEAEKELEKLRQHSESFQQQMTIIMLLNDLLIGAGFRMENITISTLTMQGEPYSEPLNHVKVAVDAGKGHGWVYAAK